MELRDWFQGAFRQDFPLQPAAPLVPLAQGIWGSEHLLGQSPKPPMVPEFRAGTDDYVLTGSWGYGVNTYAFYFVERRGPHRRFFRLGSGGAYTNEEAAAREVVEYLQAYEGWRRQLESKVTPSVLIHNLGNNTAELTVAGALKSFAGDAPPREWWARVSAACA